MHRPTNVFDFLGSVNSVVSSSARQIKGKTTNLIESVPYMERLDFTDDAEP